MTSVTLEEVKRHLRITGDADNDLLADKIKVAEVKVIRWLGDVTNGSDGKPVAPIREAILREVAEMYDGTPADTFDLLAPYRQWAF